MPEYIAQQKFADRPIKQFSRNPPSMLAMQIFCKALEKKIHYVQVDKNHNAPRLTWKNKVNTQLQDKQMNVNFFGKIESPCCSIWVLLSASDNA